jgi:beta-barrel assembly-enhancing protease
MDTPRPLFSHEFAGGVLASSLPGGRAGASLRFTPDAVAARTADGEELRVPLASAEVSRAGASGRMWFFRDAAAGVTLFSEDPALAAALSAGAPPSLQAKVAEVLAKGRADAKRSASYWLGGLAAAALLVAGGVYGLRAMGRAAVQALPRSVDTKLGELALSSMDLGGPSDTDPVLVGAVEAIAARLTPHVQPAFKLELRVVRAETLNAFALPGGKVVVYTGLLRMAESPEEVAGVLAHELAHVTRRHGLERIAQSIGVVAGVQLLFGDVSGVLAVGSELLQAGTINGYGRAQEHEADMDAVSTLRAAHVDPAALARFFERLAAQQGDTPELLTWLATHPDLKQRVADVRARSKELGSVSSQPFALDYQAVRRHAGAVLDAPAP